MSTTDLSGETANHPGAGSVVTGPVGSADLRDPSSGQSDGADLDGFPTVHVDVTSETAATQSIDESNQPVSQLEGMIANLTSYARPVLREIAARAAELAAKAAEAAGPVAHKAAGATDEYGGRLATRSREIASDLRRDSTPASDGQGAD